MHQSKLTNDAITIVPNQEQTAKKLSLVDEGSAKKTGKLVCRWLLDKNSKLYCQWLNEIG